MREFLADILAFANTAHVASKATSPAPSRNRYGVRALDVGRLEADDRVEVVLAFLPDAAYRGRLYGNDLLYIPHPITDNWVIVRDHNGAPGPLIASICLDGEDEDDE